jgi:hypothetical protein
VHKNTVLYLSKHYVNLFQDKLEEIDFLLAQRLIKMLSCRDSKYIVDEITSVT